MFASYLLTLYRSLIRHKLYSALNVLGLAVGIAAFLILLVAVRYEHSYDRWIPNAEQTYRVDHHYTAEGGEPLPTAMTAGMLMQLLRADFPQITESVRLMPERIAVRQEARSDYEDLVFADPSFFRVFDLPLAAGSKSALARPEDIVVTEATARKYFGDAPALGRPLTLTIEGTPRTYRVAAVLRDLPANTHLDFAAVAPLDQSLFPDNVFDTWNSIFLYTYLRIPSEADRDAVQAELPRFVDRHGGELGPKPSETTQLNLQALPGIHFADLDVNDAFQPGVDRVFILTLGLVGLTTLLIAAVNYVNLSTARAGLRAREVALRKVLGATEGALVVQFLTESLALTTLAALLGMALAELVLPYANAILGSDLQLTYFGEGGLVPLLAGLVLAIGLGAGLYPALVLSRFQPASVLSASKSPGGGRMGSRVREGLVALQFAISIAMVVCTAVIYGQTTFIRNADLGYQRDGLIIVQGLDQVSDRIVPLDRAFRQTPGVVSSTLSTRSPGDDQVLTTTVVRPGRNDEPEIPYEKTGPDYFRTYGIRLVAGRDFNPAARLDDLAGKEMSEVKARGLNVIVNQRAARILGFANAREAVGAPVRFSSIPATIVGVAADARFGSPREAVTPVVYLRDSDSGRFAVIRHRGDAAEMRARLEAVWRANVPGTPFQAETVEQTLDEFYAPDERRSRLFAAGALLAIAIGCIGLYGLASFTAVRRTKEIGVRKVLGATTMDVVRLLIVQFMRPVVIANLIAWPLAFALMRAWLQGFDQQIVLGPGYFLVATAVALVVALSTIAGQAVRVARADPVNALRHE